MILGIVICLLLAYNAWFALALPFKAMVDAFGMKHKAEISTLFILFIFWALAGMFLAMAWHKPGDWFSVIMCVVLLFNTHNMGVKYVQETCPKAKYLKLMGEKYTSALDNSLVKE